MDAALEQPEDYPRLGLWNASGPYIGIGRDFGTPTGLSLHLGFGKQSGLSSGWSLGL